MKKFLTSAAVLALLMSAPQASAADEFAATFRAQEKVEVTAPKKLKPVDPIKTQRPGSSTPGSSTPKTQRPGSSTPDTQKPAKPPMR